MSKSGASTFLRCRIRIGRVVVAIFALTILPAAVSAATVPGPVLRPSEALDTRRVGAVTDDERAVLRVEWRSATTGLEETQTVQEMLARLRRMEITVSEIGHLMRGMPAATPVTATVAAEPAESENRDARWALVASAAVVLLAVWWTRRRDSARHSGAGLAASPEPGSAVAALPKASLQDPTPLIVARPANVPMPIIPVEDSISLPATPDTPEPNAEPRRQESQNEDFTATVLVQHQSAPNVEPTLPPVAENAETTDSPLADKAPLIDFSLEDEDPEAVARANARVPVPRVASDSNRVPERRQETNVEATLQLAEIMLSMGLEQNAAQALLEYIDANPRHALYHWLKLLGIYRKKGLHQEFTETAEKLRQNFNIQAEDWAKVDTGTTPTLENFPRVSEYVQETWLRRPEECRDYLQRLLEDNRDGARAGFPQSVAEEILLLVEILKDVLGANQAAAT